jgi:plasmid stabilization system protein ParE
VRAVVCGSYLAYYRPLPDKGRILSVLHGAQDAAAIADRGGFDA